METTEMKYKENNITESIKLIPNYYRKHNQFEEKANEDWKRHLRKFEIGCE